MQRFLEYCASYIYKKHGDNLSDICLVFPNRRAGVFFNAYLRKQLTKPVIGPKTITINEFMLGLSDLHPADHLKLIALLYDTWLEETGFQETFDSFYYWGELLLTDFNDVDKYLVNAGELFRNISSLKDIEHQFDYLTGDQKKVIEQFWGSLGSWEKYHHEKQFVTIWGKLAAVYDRFRNKLADDHTGYPGMITRDGVERFENGKRELPYQKYLFIGLNALDACENRMFSILKELQKAEFFWDYDDYYLKNRNNNAGRFMRENLGLFPSPDDFHLVHDHFSRPRDINLVAVPSLTGQAQVIPPAYEEFEMTGEAGFDHTAIVLADESLLFHVLGAIPAQQEKINVTMGYPLKNAPLTGFLLLIANLIRNADPQTGKEPVLYHKPVTDILSHQILKGIAAEKVNAKVEEIRKENKIYLKPSELYFSEIHRKIFTLPVSTADYAAYFLELLTLLFENSRNRSLNPILKETIYATYLTIGKLKVVTDAYHLSGKTDLTPPVFFRLMMQVLNQVTVPFEGEPLCGLQVMGILETRCLDFENLIIIGLNEDSWPRNTSMPSLIPFNLRKGFGLPVSDDQDGIYAYYFHRLIQRAKNITATWNTVREGLSGGELSRFGFQLMFLSPHTVNHMNHDMPFRGNPPETIRVNSSPEISRLLLHRYTAEKALSPSAVVSFLTCSLKFWFRYVADLKEPDEVSEDIDRPLFGNIFHKAAENLYRPFAGNTIDLTLIEKLTKRKKTIDEAILKAFATEYFSRPADDHDQLQMGGKSLLIASTIHAYLRNVLETDKAFTPVYLHSLENKIECTISIPTENGTQKIRIGGIIDRLDEVDGVLRVVDYKTGTLDNQDLQFKSLGEIFTPAQKKLKKEILQTLLYALILKRSQFPDRPVTASVYAVLNLADNSFNPSVRMNGNEVEITGIGEEFEMHLREVLQNIFSPETVFMQTEFTDQCRNCPYNVICRKP